MERKEGERVPTCIFFIFWKNYYYYYYLISTPVIIITFLYHHVFQEGFMLNKWFPSYCCKWGLLKMLAERSSLPTVSNSGFFTLGLWLWQTLSCLPERYIWIICGNIKNEQDSRLFPVRNSHIFRKFVVNYPLIFNKTEILPFD